jgi:Protein of unknown function (DUF3237)
VDHGRRDLLKLAALTTLVGCAHVPLQPFQARDRKATMLFQPLLTLRLTTAATQDIGAVPYGRRVTFPIIGGSFEGARLRGKVLSGGDDWTVKRSDGVLELDARLTLQTEDGVLIHTTFDGIRDDAAAGAPYFRTRFRFETADPKYAFLNRLLAVGSGEIRADGPVHVVEEIL